MNRRGLCWFMSLSTIIVLFISPMVVVLGINNALMEPKARMVNNSVVNSSPSFDAITSVKVSFEGPPTSNGKMYNLRDVMKSDENIFSSFQYTKPLYSYESATRPNTSNSTNLIHRCMIMVATMGKLFHSFKFKGIGYAVTKSTIRLNAFSVGVRIPITAHFPEYDRIVYLPRLSAFVGCNYPFSLKGSISISLPLHSALYGIALLAKASNLVTVDIVKFIKKPKSTDSLRRIGVTISTRFTPSSGFENFVGPWIYYLPSKEFIDKVLPYICSPPASILAALNNLVSINESSILTSMDSLPANPGVMNPSPQSLAGRSEVGLLGLATAMISPPHESLYAINQPLSHIALCGLSHHPDFLGMQSLFPKVTNPNQMAIRNNSNRSRSFEFWRNRLLQWTSLKNVGMGHNFAWVMGRVDASFGSALQLDIQPFYPFASALSQCCSAFGLLIIFIRDLIFQNSLSIISSFLAMFRKKLTL